MEVGLDSCKRRGDSGLFPCLQETMGNKDGGDNQPCRWIGGVLPAMTRERGNFHLYLKDGGACMAGRLRALSLPFVGHKEPPGGWEAAAEGGDRATIVTMLSCTDGEIVQLPSIPQVTEGYAVQEYWTTTPRQSVCGRKSPYGS